MGNPQHFSWWRGGGVGGREWGLEVPELREAATVALPFSGLQSGLPLHQKLQVSFCDRVLHYSSLTLHFLLCSSVFLQSDWQVLIILWKNNHPPESLEGHKGTARKEGRKGGTERGKEGEKLLQQVEFAESILTSRGVPCPSGPHHTPGLTPACPGTELQGAYCGQPSLPSKPLTQGPQYLQPRAVTPPCLGGTSLHIRIFFPVGQL